MKKGKKLKIAQIAPLWFPVPPKGYGGTELVVSRLAENLIKRGHKVTIFASGNSTTRGKLISVVEKDLRSLGVPYLHDSYNILNLAEAFSRAEEFDILHTHIDVYDSIFRAQSRVPTVATLHNPFWPKTKQKNGKWYAYYSRLLLYNHFPKLPYVAISNSYRKQCPAKIKFVKTIYHGVDQRSLKFHPKGSNYFAWIGRFSPNKGVHIAIKIAKKLNLRLLIGGKAASPADEKYFSQKVKPLLSKNIRFVGEIKSDREKSEFLGSAIAFLYPLCWEEPFGITMIEAMACGTPVIAFNRGSVPEIVKNKKTGFIVNSEGKIRVAIKQIFNIDRKECRKHFERNFTAEKMAEEYEKVYYSLLKNK
ncbi:MAG TPA: glycosyltransferase family 4 protein [Candidatus Humimicrobiaceae bacterium]|nr:glycosyltransferase family 4 protein [Candidatus Humimicrobiaceae bacterium]